MLPLARDSASGRLAASLRATSQRTDSKGGGAQMLARRHLNTVPDHTIQDAPISAQKSSAPSEEWPYCSHSLDQAKQPVVRVSAAREAGGAAALFTSRAALQWTA